MPLATSYTEGQAGELAWLAQVAAFFNAFEGTAPANFEPVGAWTSYNPTLTGASGNPSLGTGGVSWGEYKQNGKEVKFRFGIRFGTSASQGSGIYRVSLPVTAAMPTTGLTSLMVGHGGLWRAYGALDLIGAHPEVWWYLDPSSGGAYISAVGNALNVPRETVTKSVTANQTAIASAGADVTGASVTITQKQSTGRWRIRGSVSVAIDQLNGTAGRSVYLNLQEGATHIKASGAFLGVIGNAFTGQAGIFVQTPVFIPSIGDHTYKLNVQADSGTAPNTFAVYASSTNPTYIEAEQAPGIGPMSDVAANSGNIDYVQNDNPWDWSAQASGAEMWGQINYHAA